MCLDLCLLSLHWYQLRSLQLEIEPYKNQGFLSKEPLALRIIIQMFIAGFGVFVSSALVFSDTDSETDHSTFDAFEWRTIGPAFMSGRISDIDWDPTDYSVWYVAAGSGGVWKTTNSGVTWDPIFDEQPSYSIGNVTVDPSNPHTVWVGTGEDVGGRHVGFGDGIYRSDDGGISWTNKGLRESQHISTILVHPQDSQTVWVAVQGPLWASGGERGLYLTNDGGNTWERTLGDDKWTGVTDIVIDPRDPKILYAATWQRHRTVAAYMGGGPKSGIHRSADGGRTWTRLTKGLPTENMGKIGLSISPQNPDVIYAAVELNRRKGAVYRSKDRGSSWSRGADAVGGGTGPHYYQEIFASPHSFDRLYLVGPTVQKSEDGGKTFAPMDHPNQHGDMHSIVFNPKDPQYIMMGTDGGVYESFDLGASWRYMENLPLTQYYKVALDDSEPFYKIYGGTQDNNTQGGPSRTDNKHGIRTADWHIVLGGDGHQPATEPGNPDILYAQSQRGNLNRIDMVTGETIYIKPQPSPNDPPERFNWDSPILVSPHNPKQIYFASQRVWKSEHRGDDWRAISGDLTRDEDRMLMPLMDRTWSWDAPWDMYAMSDYNTITSLSESPIEKGLLYAGTDDGLINISEDSGKSWRQIEVGTLPGVPDAAFVNDIRADLYDADTVYVALDHHKYGDFSPYILVSKNRGKTWSKIVKGIPDKHLVWRLVQDHINPKLMFAGTEFGVFMTRDAGKSWQKLASGMPTIPVRDLKIQRRENDLVAASFGRGFFILDDYSPLREATKEAMSQPAKMFEVREADWYFQRGVIGRGRKGSQGDELYVADNPDFGAIFTYHLSEGFETTKAIRQKYEKNRLENRKPVQFPGWGAVEAERREEPPEVLIIIRDDEGKVVRRIHAPADKGFHRVAWDLRHPYYGPLTTDSERQDYIPRGFMAKPGDYSAELVLFKDGNAEILSETVSFKVKRLYNSSLAGASPEEVDEFWTQLASLSGKVGAAQFVLKEAMADLELLKKLSAQTPWEVNESDSALYALKQRLFDLEESLIGSDLKASIGGYDKHSVASWLSHATRGVSNSSYGPTASHLQSFEYAQDLFIPIRSELNQIISIEIPALRDVMSAAGSPWSEGLLVPED